MMERVTTSDSGAWRKLSQLSTRKELMKDAGWKACWQGRRDWASDGAGACRTLVCEIYGNGSWSRGRRAAARIGDESTTRGMDASIDIGCCRYLRSDGMERCRKGA